MAITAPLPATGQREAIQKPSRTAIRRVGVSATLAANEALQARRRRGERVLPLHSARRASRSHRCCATRSLPRAT